MRWMWLMCSCLLLVVACGGNEDDQAGAGPPPWVDSVYPEPGASATGVSAVEVRHTITDPELNIRLVIDGVDVTTYSDFSGGVLRYDAELGPVRLEPGPHEAEVQRVRLPADEVDYEVIDSYSWEFRVH